jgi:hypothetical protein
MPTILKTKNSVTTTVVPTTLQQGELAVNITDKKLWVGNAATTPVQLLGAGVTGDVVGPASATDNAISRFDATTGKLIQNSLVTVSDTGAISAPVDASISSLTVGRGAGAIGSNTALGITALAANTTGTENTALGYRAAIATTTGAAITAVGSGALFTNTTGSNNTAVGQNVLVFNTTASNNTAVGYQASFSNTTGAFNSAFGAGALQANTTASENTAVGYQAGYSNTTGTALVALGYRAAYNNTTGSASTAVGYLSGFANTTGEITAIGYSALTANTTGTFNTALGRNSLVSNTTGGNNTAVGRQALNGNTTASNNTAVGYQAGYSGTTANSNVFVGAQAGYSVTTAAANTCVGGSTGYSLTTGVRNTFVGVSNQVTGAAGGLVTTGSNNTVIGGFDGNQGGLDIRTASNNIVLSDGDGNPRFYANSDGKWFNPSGYFGTASGGGIYTAGANQVLPTNGTSLSDNGVSNGSAFWRWSVIYAGTALINTSDANLKQQIRNLDDAEKAVAQSIKGLIKAFKFNDSVAEKGNNARIHIGVIAQEVKEAFESQGLDASKYGMFCLDTLIDENGQELTRLGIRYDELLAFVISTL